MKKKAVIITLIGVLLIVLAVLTPKTVKKVLAASEEKRLSNNYEAFMENNNKFFKNTFLNGEGISGLTVSDVYNKMTKEYESGKLTVTTPFNDSVLSFYFKDLNTDFTPLNEFLNEAFSSQNMSKEEFYGEKEKTDFSFDMASLIDINKADFSKLSIADPLRFIVSKDAYLDIDKENGKVTIVPEVMGTELKPGALEKKICEAIKNQTFEVSLTYDDYVCPKVTKDDEDLIKKCEYYDILLNKTISLNVSGMGVVLNPSDTREYLDLESEELVNKDAVLDYSKELKRKYDTFGLQRPFITSTGESIIIPGGDYGWIINAEETSDAICEALKSDQKNVTMNACYTRWGQRPANNEISDTYVEISLRDQKIWMYVNGVQIVNDDCTTGMVGDPECITNCGMFNLTFKVTDRVLRGPTWEDFVYYWMPFDGSNGMHDATWRTDEEFGGTNRFGNGSHGCVNLRLPIAEIVYNNIQMDTPVIIWE